jgi:hypothetical protein
VNVIDEEDIPFNTPDQVEAFKVLKCKLPMFVWAQIKTHTQLCSVAKTSRREEEVEFWYPNDFGDNKRFVIHVDSGGVEGGVVDSLEFVQRKIHDYFRSLKYKPEIYQRALYYFQYKTFFLGGWANDPKRWLHLCIERNTCENWKNWTQEETREAVMKMKNIVFPYWNTK